jgi:hypothetical protein
MNLSDEFNGVVDALETQGIPYAVCGGFAVAIHGYPRMTQDVDILVREESVPDIEAAVRGLGFDVVAGKFAFKRGTPEETRFWRVTKHDESDYLVLDAVLVTPALENAWETRERILLGEREVSVVSRSGLTLMKQLAGRAKDVADLQMLGILPRDETEPEPL